MIGQYEQISNSDTANTIYNRKKNVQLAVYLFVLSNFVGRDERVQ